MGDRLKIGDFGFFEFEIFKKTRYGNFTTFISGHYEIIDSDAKNIEITDGQKTLIVTKRRIKTFIPKEKPAA